VTILQRRKACSSAASRSVAAFLLVATWGAGAFAQRIEQPPPRVFKPAQMPEPRTTTPPDRTTPSRPVPQRRLTLVPFKTAPFPYDGSVPPDDRPFFDLAANGNRGRTTRTGTVYWERETYSDRRVLVHFAKGFDASHPGVIVLYLHGNGSTLQRDVARRQALLDQVDDSGVNAVLLAPQLAVDALDSSAGRFWEAGALARFLDEAAAVLARLRPAGKRGNAAYRKLQVVIVAYSGGYLPAAWLLHHGGAEERVAGVAILDGVYGEQEKFASWIKRRRSAFFVSAYGKSSAEGNLELRRLLAPLSPARDVPRSLTPGATAFVEVPPEATHQDFVTQAWVMNPVADLLSRIPGYGRSRPKTARR
jgi:hypothetical protein